MLQWMGGSRRKVTTTRKSTQKRQKQYFEQRKRQQQQTAGLDSYADHKEHRSLDVLSWLNLPVAAQEQNCARPSGREDLELNVSEQNCDITKAPLKVFTNKATPADFVEIKEVVAPSGYQLETVSPENPPFTAPDNRNNAFNESNYKSNLWETTAEQQTSVFDLLADDGPSANLEGSPVREDHVAFSVEGLGKVGTQTPVHTPKCPGRVFQYGCPSPRKAVRKHNSSKNFDYVLDDLDLEVGEMMQDMNAPHSGSYSEFSTGIVDSHSNLKNKYSTVYDCAPFDGYGSKITSSFDDSNIYSIGNNNEDLWDARSSFLENDFLNEKEHESRKSWPCEMEEVDFLKYGNDEIPNYAFEGCRLQESRNSVKATDKYRIQGSPSPKHQTSYNDGDFVTSMRTRYTAGRRNFGFREVISQPDWSYYGDERDNLSLLSEESCSSSAVLGEGANTSPANSTARRSRRRHKDTFGGHVNVYEFDNIYAKERHHRNRVDIEQGSYSYGSGKCTRTPTPSKFKQFQNLNSPFQEKFGLQESWLFDEGYTPVDTISGFSSLRQPAVTKAPSIGAKPQMEDRFGGFPFPESHIDAKFSLDGSKYVESADFSTFGSFVTEKSTFCKPYSHINCHDSPLCSKVEVGPTKKDLSLDSESGGKPADSFHVASCHGETLFSDLSAQESVSEDEENKSNSQPVEAGKQSCVGKNNMVSENMKAMEASNSKETILECKEAKCGTLESTESLKTASSSKHAEETSSSVKIPDKFESSVHEEEYNHDVEVSLSCQNESEDLNAGRDAAEPEQRVIVSKRQANCVDSSNPNPVVMLESYVLQLLCVQKKVLKDASEQSTIKERLREELVGSFLQAPVHGKDTKYKKSLMKNPGKRV